MEQVPLEPLASQQVRVGLGGQECVLNIYQKFFGLYMDVTANGVTIIQGVVCQNLNRIVRSLYLGFIGDFVFFDTQGNDDPDYTGLGERFQLIYLEADDLLPGQG